MSHIRGRFHKAADKFVIEADVRKFEYCGGIKNGRFISKL